MYTHFSVFFCALAVTAFPDLLRRQSFDAGSQHIDVLNAHAFVAAGPSDLCGPCPALNAVANHGYIARNGYTNVQESIDAIVKVYGIGHDVAFLLAECGGTSRRWRPFLDRWSAREDPPYPWGFIGHTEGNFKSRNRFEGDVSHLRGDLYQFGEAYLTKLPFFQGLYDLPGAGAVNPNYDLDLLGNYAVTRPSISLAKPLLLPRLLRLNNTSDYTCLYLSHVRKQDRGVSRGVLGSENTEVLLCYLGDEGSLTYSPGQERIPDNWYTRAASDPYDAQFLLSNFKTLVQEHPELAAFGGNTGTVNSFVGLDIANLTGGIFNAETLFQGNNLGCFIFQSVAIAATDLIRNGDIIADVSGAIAQINNAVTQAISGLGCPQLSQYDYDAGQLAKYPGYTKLKKDGTYS